MFHMPNHTPDLGCYIPSPEDIATAAAKIKRRKLAAKRKEKPGVEYREPRIVKMHENGRVMRKAVH